MTHSAPVAILNVRGVIDIVENHPEGFIFAEEDPADDERCMRTDLRWVDPILPS